MLELTRALELIEQNCQPLNAQTHALSKCVGLVTAQAVQSNIDSPPYDKSMMDGFALRSQDINSGIKTLSINECILAGQVPTAKVTEGTASQIMTGAPVPDGCDAVVMIEQTNHSGSVSGKVEIEIDSVKSGQNILRRAEVFADGDEIIPKGHRIGAKDIGVLAEIGAAQCQVFPAANVAIVATGDELVDFDKQPGPGQLRNSNGPMLESMVARAGATPRNLGIVVDDERQLRSRIESGLQSDILLLTGGVSAGTADLVPKVLRDLNVQKIFHKVAVKPGKPLWFGKHQGGDHCCLVFGLPGNPASSLVGFELFVRLAIKRLQGEIETPANGGSHPQYLIAQLNEDFSIRGDREVFWPAVAEQRNGSWICRALNWRGSADIRAISQANSLARFMPVKANYQAGDSVQLITLYD